MYNQYYLNNSGNRWVSRDQYGKSEKHTFTTKSGKIVIRASIYYEMFGNFAVICISYKGKRIRVFPETILED